MRHTDIWVLYHESLMNGMTYNISFLTDGIHFECLKRRLAISLTKAIVGSMKWYTGHTFTHGFNNNINYNVAMSDLVKVLLNHAMEIFSYCRFL